MRPAGRQRLRAAGAGIPLGLLPVCLLAGCGEPPPPPFDYEASLRLELGIDAGTPIHRVTLGGRGSDDRVVPLRVEAAPGDVLHVLSADLRIQTFSFDLEALDADQQGFLERSSQVGSPPLTDPGSRWVVSLEGAPEGEYPFIVLGHGDPVRGAVDVRRRR